MKTKASTNSAPPTTSHPPACAADTRMADTRTADIRMAAAVDPELKSAAVRRLRRIAGQVRGLEAMVEQERYCADILVQIASAQEALRGVGRLLMRNHLEHCATMAIRDGGPAATAMYDELLDLVYRHAR